MDFALIQIDDAVGLLQFALRMGKMILRAIWPKWRKIASKICGCLSSGSTFIVATVPFVKGLLLSYTLRSSS